MSRGVVRWVMPKTIEAKKAKMSAALKWESCIVLFFLPDGDVVGVHGADYVQQASNDDVLGAIVGRRELNGPFAPVHHVGDEVESAVSEIADEAEHVEQSAAVRAIDFAFHRHTEHKHGEYARHENQSAQPAPLNQMPCSGH